MEAFQKTGYLNSDFKLFHIISQKQQHFDLHYHDFHKVFFFLRGNASYIVEGKQYDLQPFDVVLIRAGEIHRPVLHDSSVYERVILYLSDDFFQKYRTDSWDLYQCFAKSQLQHSNLLRFTNADGLRIQQFSGELTAALLHEEYGAPLLQQLKTVEFLLLLSRLVLQDQTSCTAVPTANPVVLQVMDYIREHLMEELSIDTLASRAFLNRSYLMHLFKAETGCTIGKYITEKRLFAARSCLQKGLSVTEACYQSGFQSYASFYHAYKAKYHTAPTIASSSHLEEED